MEFGPLGTKMRIFYSRVLSQVSPSSNNDTPSSDVGHRCRKDVELIQAPPNAAIVALW